MIPPYAIPGLLGLLILLHVVWLYAIWRKRHPKGVNATLLTRARVLVTEQDREWPDRSGEAKRHQVMARLHKEFSGVSLRALSRVIEDALG